MNRRDDHLSSSSARGYANFIPQEQRFCTVVSSIPRNIFSIVTHCFERPTTIILKNNSRITLGNLIAEGGFSFVYKGENVVTGQIYAVKKVVCQSEEQVENVENEINTHRMVSHSGLLPLVDYQCIRTSNTTNYFLVFPFYERGTLRNYIDDTIVGKQAQLLRSSQESEILRLFLLICYAVEALHHHDPPITHRDIKPENILLGQSGNPVLMDFGSSVKGEVTILSRLDALQLQEEAEEHSSMAYRAPELYDPSRDSVITTKTDVWSLGCLLYALAFGYSPFECEFNHMDELRIVDCSYLRVIGILSFPESCRYSTKFCETIRWLLEKDHIARPTISQVIHRISNL